ncbi:hypothetical protein PAECIP111892_01792 [Paenibacillus auburnensis]|uniref:Uncharacterized protein n=1 Tax=Paenibacillus auburnensis TaxID=2905649 RepID=A0ABN8FXU9_9BACL|nr:hypothetical protein [Paenibacillus auburnensis]CAH1194665.1 hypothetical protein PAECIP111892_01792 [Paenibacillus auburnensis]
MITYGLIGIISIGSVLVEKRCRMAGNTNGALAARRFGRMFLLAAGGLIAIEYVRAMLALLG